MSQSPASRREALAWLEAHGLACTRPAIGAIDAGVRDVVQALWDAGVHTTDSGDGRSKPLVGRAMDVEHVVVVEPLLESTSAAAWRLREALQSKRPGEAWLVEVISGHEVPGRREPKDLIVATRMDAPWPAEGRV